MDKRKRSTANPIIAAVQRSLDGKPLYPIPYRLPKLLEGLLVSTFDSDAIREVGRLVCLALLIGDRRIIKTVRDALKESDHLFNRDREIELAMDVMTYLPALWRKLSPDPVALKKEIEKRSNNGKPLHQHQWNRLRKALDLPKLPVGRRGNRDTKR